MKQFYKPSLAIVGATCLAIAAVGMAQRLPDLNSAPAARDATQLSSVFRQVSRDVLPSIVSIETRGRSVGMQSEFPLGEDHPFRKFFESDPRMQQYFKNQQPEFNRQGKGSGFVIDRSGEGLHLSFERARVGIEAGGPASGGAHRVNGGSRIVPGTGPA